MPQTLFISAIAKMYDPPLPVLFKKIVGPASYDATNGYTISLEELKRIAMVFQAGPIIGTGGEYIVIKSYTVVGDTVNIKFGKIQADTSTGAITVVDLDDGSTALNGVLIPIIAVADTTAIGELQSQPL